MSQHNDLVARLEEALLVERTALELVRGSAIGKDLEGDIALHEACLAALRPPKEREAVAWRINWGNVGWNYFDHLDNDRIEGLRSEGCKVEPLYASPPVALPEGWRDRMTELERLVYVPGLWRCAKCDFQLVQANLNARDGSVTSRDQPGDKCPNCASPLWRVTERDAGNRLIDQSEAIAIENLRLRQALGAHIQADAYRDTFPDNEQDAKHLRKQETWWRLTGRSWLAEGDEDRCAREAKARAMLAASPQAPEGA